MQSVPSMRPGQSFEPMMRIFSMWVAATSSAKRPKGWPSSVLERRMAQAKHAKGLATLRFDLLSEDEARDISARFDIPRGKGTALPV